MTSAQSIVVMKGFPYKKCTDPEGGQGVRIAKIMDPDQTVFFSNGLISVHNVCTYLTV